MIEFAKRYPFTAALIIFIVVGVFVVIYMVMTPTTFKVKLPGWDCEKNPAPVATVIANGAKIHISYLKTDGSYGNVDYTVGPWTQYSLTVFSDTCSPISVPINPG